MSDKPEHIREILKRVFEDLEKHYEKKLSKRQPLEKGKTMKAGDEICIVCGNPPYVVGLFFPDQSANWNTPSRSGAFLYFLCKDCYQKDKISEIVEGIISINQGVDACHANC